MIARTMLSILAITLLSLPAGALAEVDIAEVTPELIKANPKAFSVLCKRQEDGALMFKIVHRTEQPRWLQATITLKIQGKQVAKTVEAAETSTELERVFFVTVPTDQIDQSVVTIADRGIGEIVDAKGRKIGPQIPDLGGTNYLIRLKHFRPRAAASSKTVKQ